MWIDLTMALSIVVLDVHKLRCVLEGRMVPIQISQPLVQVRISATNVSYVTLKVLHVYRIKADDGREEPDVCFCDVVAEVEGPTAICNVFLCSIESLEESRDIFLVGFLSAGSLLVLYFICQQVPTWQSQTCKRRY